MSGIATGGNFGRNFGMGVAYLVQAEQSISRLIIITSWAQQRSYCAYGCDMKVE